LQTQPATTPEPTAETTATTTEPEAAPATETETEEAAPLAFSDLKLPEGHEANEETMSQFLEVANKHGLSADTANELLGLYSEELTRLFEAQTSEFPQTVEQWRQEALALPDMAEGKREATTASIGKLLNQFGDEHVREALTLTGAGDHPAVVQFFINVAKALGEGGFQGGSPGQAPVSREQALFGDMFAKE